MPLSLEVTDPGFDFTLWHDFRQRILAHEAGNGSWIPSWLPAKPRAGSRRGARNGPIPSLSWRRFARSIVWDVPWKLCIGPSTSSVRSAPRLGATAYTAGVVSPLWPAFRPGAAAEGRQHTRSARSPDREAAGYRSSWNGSAFQKARQAAVSSRPWRLCGAFGSNSMTAVRSLGGKRSAGAPATSNRPRRCAAPPPITSRARYSSIRDTHWVGYVDYKVHLTEACDADQPDLITQVLTMSATT